MKSKLKPIIAHEVHIHYKRPLFDTEKKIGRSEDCEKIIRALIDDDRIDHKEFFWVLLLNTANQVLGFSETGIGTVKGVAVNFTEICQLAILSNAVRVVISHNHPSGKLELSPQDRKLTDQIQKGLKLFGIELLDHLIITSESYYSFSDNDLL